MSAFTVCWPRSSMRSPLFALSILCIRPFAGANGQSAEEKLLAAARVGNLDLATVKRAFVDVVDLYAIDGGQIDLLGHAIARGKMDIVTWLLDDAKFDLNRAVKISGRIAAIGCIGLTFAAEKGETELVRRFLKAGVD